MSLNHLYLCLSAAAAGAINAVAGGGTLLTFPALFGALGSTAAAAVIANATSTVALVPGAAAAGWGFRREISAMRRWLYLLLAPSLLGGFVGSLLVAELPPELFKLLVPWLILTAALLFALQPTIARLTGIGQQGLPHTRRNVAGVIVFQFFVAVYGGYFGAGVGILMLCGLSLMGLPDIHTMNAVKILLNCAINGVSVVVFTVAGQVRWDLALMMAASSVVGGYAGARISRRLDPRLVRGAVVVIGFVLAAYYFYGELVGTDP